MFGAPNVLKGTSEIVRLPYATINHAINKLVCARKASACSIDHHTPSPQLASSDPPPPTPIRNNASYCLVCQVMASRWCGRCCARRCCCGRCCCCARCSCCGIRANIDTQQSACSHKRDKCSGVRKVGSVSFFLIWGAGTCLSELRGVWLV